MTYEKCEPKPCIKERIKLECVVVCVDYGDFLRCTLSNNKHLFDRMVVVTSPKDTETQKLCEFYHVECVKSSRMVEKGFNKGIGINEGLARLDKDAWLIHLDADIWLPPQTRILLEQAQLDKSMIYGMDRFNVIGYNQWEKFLRKPLLQHEAGSYIHINNNPFDVGTRFMQAHMDGYVPIGFFQMWNPKVSGVFKYPENKTGAGNSDVLFSWQWPRAKRSFIPEVIGYHLESIDAGFGTNWLGRKTAPFEKLSIFQLAKIHGRRIWNSMNTKS
jgi:hypothetical protein